MEENTETGIHGLFHMQNRLLSNPTQGILSPAGRAGGFC